MSSGKNPRTIAYVLGILGSVGGFLSFIGWALIFQAESLGAHGENAPLYTTLQDLVLTGLGIASALGMLGASLSRRYTRTGGIVMLAGAGTALAALPYVFGNPKNLITLVLLPSFGSWALVLLFGGLFGALTRVPHQSGRGTPGVRSTIPKTPLDD